MAHNTSQDQHHDDQNENIDRGRRSFLKKAAYSTPSLVALGTLTTSQNAQAQIGPNPSFDQTNSAAAPIPEPD